MKSGSVSVPTAQVLVSGVSHRRPFIRPAEKYVGLFRIEAQCSSYFLTVQTLQTRALPPPERQVA